MNFDHITFTDASDNPIPYDGSQVTWRISAYGLTTQQDKLLLVKPKNRQYELPGGGIEINESVEQALIRETLEEAGQPIKVKCLLTWKEHYFYLRTYKNYYKTLLLFFHCQPDGPAQKPTDKKIEKAVWVPRNQIKKHPMRNQNLQEIVDTFFANS